MWPFSLTILPLQPSQLWPSLCSLFSPSRFASLSTVASSNLGTWASRLSDSLDLWSSRLPDPLHRLISTQVTPLVKSLSAYPPPSLTERIGLLLSSHQYLSYATAASTVLAFIYLVYSMSSYTPGYVSTWGGRRSPYSSAAGDRSVTENDFEYLGADFAERVPSHHHRPSVPRNHGYYDEDSPDVILIRHMNRQHELEFKPFAISDGILRIEDIRAFAAEKLNAPDPSRLRLLYKGKQLKHDKRSAKDYGLKQQSEIMVVVSETPPSRPNSDTETAENETMGRHGSRKEKAGGRKIKSRRSNGSLAPRADDSGLSSKRDSVRGSRAPSPNPLSVPVESPAARSFPPQSPSVKSPPLQSPPLQSPKSDSARGKVNQLASTFHTQWVPKCVQFLMHPPSDAKAREQEHKKLSESILAQIMLKADDIELEGDLQARAERKKLLEECNGMFKKLDAAAKGPGA